MNPPRLVICRAARGLATGLPVPGDAPIVLASDDPCVQHAARALPGVTEVCHLERMTSFYAVAPDVRRVVTAIDDWLAGYAARDPRVSPEVLRWGCTVEGGQTSQRVQDALLLIGSYVALVERLRPQEIVLLSTPAHQWEDDILAAVAATRRVPLRRPPATPAAWRLRAWERLRPLVVAAYQLLHFVRRGGARPGQAPAPFALSQNALLVFVCSSARTHRQNVAPLLAAAHTHGLRVAACTWLANERMGATDRADWAGPHTPVIALEHWARLADVLDGAALVRRVRRYTRANPAPWLALEYQGIPLSPVLAPALRHFLGADLPARWRYQRALAAAFGSTLPLAVKPWGAPESFEYRAICQLWPAAARPLCLQYWLGASLPWPYADPRQRLDLFLAKDAPEAAQVRADYQLSDDQVRVVGSPRLANYRRDETNLDAAAARAALGAIHDPVRLYIGFDPNCALRGYQSHREQADITRALLRAAAAEPRLTLLVKPHPAYSIDHLAPLFAEFANPQVVVLAGGAALPQFLAAIDVMVTKYSTLILEAALFRRVALPVILDGEPRFQVFGDLAAPLTDAGELETLLRRLAGDLVFRATWLAQRRADQERHLQANYFPANDGNSAARAAAAIGQAARAFRAILQTSTESPAGPPRTNAQ